MSEILPIRKDWLEPIPFNIWTGKDPKSGEYENVMPYGRYFTEIMRWINDIENEVVYLNEGGTECTLEPTTWYKYPGKETFEPTNDALDGCMLYDNYIYDMRVAIDRLRETLDLGVKSWSTVTDSIGKMYDKVIEELRGGLGGDIWLFMDNYGKICWVDVKWLIRGFAWEDCIIQKAELPSIAEEEKYITHLHYDELRYPLYKIMSLLEGKFRIYQTKNVAGKSAFTDEYEDFPTSHIITGFTHSIYWVGISQITTIQVAANDNYLYQHSIGHSSIPDYNLIYKRQIQFWERQPGGNWKMEYTDEAIDNVHPYGILYSLVQRNNGQIIFLHHSRFWEYRRCNFGGVGKIKNMVAVSYPINFVYDTATYIVITEQKIYKTVLGYNGGGISKNVFYWKKFSEKKRYVGIARPAETPQQALCINLAENDYDVNYSNVTIFRNPYIGIYISSLPPNLRMSKNNFINIETFGGRNPYAWEVSNDKIAEIVSTENNGHKAKIQALEIGTFYLRVTDSVGQKGCTRGITVVE